MNLNIQTNQFNLPVRIQVGEYENNQFTGVIWHCKKKQHPKNFLSLINEFEVTHVQRNEILKDPDFYLEDAFFHKCYAIKEKEIIKDHIEEGISLFSLSVNEEVFSDSELFHLPFEKDYYIENINIDENSFVSKVYYKNKYFNFETTNKDVINHLVDFCNVESYTVHKDCFFSLNKNNFDKNLKKY